MAGRLFRKAAIERRSSPEQLDALMQVTPPKAWISLAAAGFLLACFVAWGFFGELPVEVGGRGILVSIGTPLMAVEPESGPGSLRALAYFPAGSGQRVRTGMAVRVSPLSVEKAEYGYIEGKVRSVAESPASRGGMQLSLGDESLVAELYREGAPIEVSADLAPDPRTTTGFKWSSSGGPDFALRAGAPCLISVVIARQKPIALLFPGLTARAKK
jgi:HlyD family secretion protein